MTASLARDVAARINLAPLLHEPGAVETLAANIRALAGAKPAEEAAAFEARKGELVAAYDLPATAQRKPFAFADGVAVIPVHGLLLNRFSASWGFVTGYNFIRAQVEAAAADADVRTIVLDVNSHGGMAAGCMETADVIHAARQAKPIVAVIDAYAFSTGYALASAASRVVITPSGGAGSIGVVTMHVSIEKALQDAGIEVTFVHAGAKKVDGNPYETLSESAQADIQHRVDALYDQLVTQVSRNRGLSASAVRETEAAIFTAADAKAAGLVDAIASPGAALTTTDSDAEEGSMSTTAKTMTTAEIQKMVDAEVTKRMDAHTARIAAIAGHEAAKGREGLANHLARNTTMSTEDAVAILQAAPTQSQEQVGAGAFLDAMNRGGSPGVGADADGSAAGIGGGHEGDAVTRVLGALKAATGFDPAAAKA